MKEITTNELAEKLDTEENLNIIDVREDDEVAQGMIPGATHIPLGELPANLDKLDQNKEYILVCRSGGRSGKAQAFLDDNGFKTINMAGGMLDWDGPTK